MAHISEVIINPVLTEKSATLTDELNTYCFRVLKSSNKIEIKSAIEKYFDVKVEKITTTTNPGKLRRFGKGVKKRPHYKKAYVKIAEGQKIELFKGI